MMRFAVLVTAFAAVCRSAAVTQQPMTCKDIVIPVDVSANNKQFPKGFNISSLTTSFLDDVLATLPTVLTGGKYSLAGRYCEPTKAFGHGRQNTLQLLIHGITYDRNWWSGLAPPGTKDGQDEYSWLVYASKQGYPTLSIDRLCNGASTKADGLLECQVPLQAETMHAVIQQAKAGSLPGVSKKFSRVVLVGHSYGSLVGSALALQHPDDADAMLLTGFTDQLLFGEAGVTLEPSWNPAALQDPAKFGTEDPSYIIATSASGVRELFYYGNFDPKVLAYDFDHRQTTTLGELGTVTFGQLKAPEYKGPIFVINGDHDTVFCETSALSPALKQPGDCTGLDQNVKDFFPSASVFKYMNAPDTGHCLNTHHTAQSVFKAAHDFLSQVGY